jgi:hypothetical protein
LVAADPRAYHLVTSMEPEILVLVLTAIAIVFGPILGAESRPGFRRPERNPRPMVSSMRPSDWPPSEFGP